MSLTTTVCTSENKYVLILLILYRKTLVLQLKWNTGKVRDKLGGTVRFKGGLRGIIITEINQAVITCSYFLKYKY